uniref:RNA helicase n=1 Tax=Fopius arisanus TaxID=64838 RepID=A0A0C9RKH2_9HYME
MATLTFPNSNLKDLEKKYSHIADSEFKREFLNVISGNFQENLAISQLLASNLVENRNLDDEFKLEQQKRESCEDYIKMCQFRSKLPSYKMKYEILDQIQRNQVVMIDGETGCGKTTQVGQFILDEEIKQGRGSVTKIVCTQPRRISAVSAAERVAAERAEPLGISVGYQVRLEKVRPRDCGSILFCTNGILYQYIRSDPTLRDFSHIILDEIHERTIDNDLIITLLKQIIPKRPDLRVILMSATINSEMFANYYDNCANIHIPGFTYPVKEFYLEDILHILPQFEFPLLKVNKNWKNFLEIKNKMKAYDDLIVPALRKMEANRTYPFYVTNKLRNPNSEELSLQLIEDLLVKISTTKKAGAILVFLPGILDISNLHRTLLNSRKFPPEKFHIYAAHSTLPLYDQKLIFEPPIAGVRKIILATSIAETSITIEDVVYVIDCGRIKVKRYDVVKKLENLACEWMSKANGKQRKGRAGRVQNGEIYKLFTRARENTFSKYPMPEILISPLEDVILQIKMLQLGKVAIFLKNVMDPPKADAIEASLCLLRNLNALDSDENLTPLGYHLAKLPLDLQTGKMVLLASIFSCIEPIFGIAASLAFKDPFYNPVDKEKEAKAAKLDFGKGEASDHIPLAEALRQYEAISSEAKAKKFCSENFLSPGTLKLLMDMRQQFAEILYEMKFLESDDPKDPRSNKNSHQISLIKAIICSALYPQIAINGGGWDGKGLKFTTLEGESVKIHPRSLNAKLPLLPSSYVTYFHKQKSSHIFLHDTTCVSQAALIFATPNCQIRHDTARTSIVVNPLLSFSCTLSKGKIAEKLRDCMYKMLEQKIIYPGAIEWRAQQDLVMEAIIEFLSENDGQLL